MHNIVFSSVGHAEKNLLGRDHLKQIEKGCERSDGDDHEVRKIFLGVCGYLNFSAVLCDYFLHLLDRLHSD